jgi:uncharacterized protein YcbK (DUF882 family)
MQGFSAMRRCFSLALIATTTLTTVMPAFADDGYVMPADDVRSLSFRHTHTHEQIDVVYWRNGGYVEDSLARINRFLRDFRTSDETTMDPKLLDVLYKVYRQSGSNGQFEVISAYRSPKTNEMLRSRSANSGVANKSQHLLGKAIDIRLTDVPTATLRKVAYDLGLGGVGYYHDSNFVHLDTGRFRTW